MTSNVVLVAVGLPLGILLTYFLASRDPGRLQRWMPWIYGVVALLQVPILLRGIRTGTYRLSFWVAVLMSALTVVMLLLHWRELHRQRAGIEQ